MWLNDAELAGNGFTLEDVSGHLAGFTKPDTIKAGDTPEFGHGSDRVSSAVLASTMLTALPRLPEARDAS